MSGRGRRLDAGGRGGPGRHACAPRARGPDGAFPTRRRGGLRGRIFWWFGAAILTTVAVVALVFHLLGDGRGWARQRAGAARFLGDRLAQSWDDPAARSRLVADLGRDLDLDLVLRDASGRVVDQAGACTRPDFTVPVPDRGTLGVCWRRQGPPWRLAVALLAAVAVLWGASGLIARRIARPLVHLAGVARDLGDGKLASRARLDWRAPGELGTLSQTVNDMAGKLERQLREQRELLAAVSHELRTPLGHLRLIGELLAPTADPARLAQLEREVEEMDRLVGELLASARVDFSALAPTRLDAAALARTALERSHLPTERLRVEVGDAYVVADPTLLLRALGNLLENAQRHGGGLDHLVVRERPGRLVLEAEDRGPGFGEAEAARAFQPFQRRSGGGGGSGGTDQGADERSLGLGLSLVRRIAEAHGGGAYVRNREGGGAVVGLELPRDS